MPMLKALIVLLAATTTFAQAPKDAVVLFDGDLGDAWVGSGGADPAWTVEDGILRIAPGTGSISTTRPFADMLLHLEFRLPETGDDVTGQAKANSGVYIQQRYEVQILDSHGDKPDARSCGAIYGRKAADVDALIARRAVAALRHHLPRPPLRRRRREGRQRTPHRPPQRHAHP